MVINETETEKGNTRNQWIKELFLKRIGNTDKLLAKLTKKGRKRPLSLQLEMRKAKFYSCFQLSFVMKGFFIVSKSFSAFIEILMWFLSLIVFVNVLCFINFCKLGHSCFHGIKSMWSLFLDQFLWIFMPAAFQT